MLKLLLITIILVGIAFAGLGIRILLERNGEFSGGSCQSGSKGLDDKGISCGVVQEPAFPMIKRELLNRPGLFIGIDQFQVYPESGEHKSDILIFKCFSWLRSYQGYKSLSI